MKSLLRLFPRRRGLVLFAGKAMAPLLATYLYLGPCGAGKSGFVLSVHVGKVAVTAAWCEAPTPAPTRG